MYEIFKAVCAILALPTGVAMLALPSWDIWKAVTK